MSATLEAPRTKRPSIKPGVAKARLAYLYGVNGSDPIVSTEELALIGKLNKDTINRHIGKWKVEAEQMALDAVKARAENTLSAGSLSLAVSTEIIEQAKQDILTMRMQVDLYAGQLTEMSNVLKMLRDFMENFDDDRDYALRCFESFLNGAGSRANILANYLKVQAQWAKACGLEAINDVKVTGAKVLISAQAKASAEVSNEDDKTEDSLGISFKRR